MSRLWPEPSGDTWGRIGRLEVTTTMAVVLMTVASWLVWVVAPFISSVLAFVPETLLRGEVWRLVTWPLAGHLGLFEVINLFFFWYFGSDLEREVGRVRMARLLVGIWVALTVATLVAGLLLPGTAVLAGIGLVQFAVLLVWIAESPNRPFFFGIPAWVLGAVLVALQLLLMLAGRDAAGLLALVLSLVFVAMVAKRQGLLSQYAFIPGGPAPAHPRASRRPPKPSRAEKVEARQATRRASDRERLDQLLDRINEGGIGALTDAERRELMELRDRLRNR